MRYESTMSIEVIGAGFGRTGTTSLKAALEQLGFDKCHHMSEVIAHPEQAEGWLAAHAGEPVDWDALLAGYRSTTDWPACGFYRELMEAYPEAKVVLSVRDPARWYESVRETIYPLTREAPRWFVRLFAPGLYAVNRLGTDMIFDGVFGGRFEDREHALAVYAAHVEEVERAVPPERLLIYSVKQGWEPLCAFLDVPVPEGPFPHLNERAMLQRVLKAVKVGAALIPLLALGLIALLLYWWLATNAAPLA